jgi:pyruvate/2-oxoglutarate dehydrogenase complex dihydrolipoamide acyltransferase (E2) component
MAAGYRNGMAFHYFLPVPKLSPDVRDQSGSVELLAWLVPERAPIRPDQPVAHVQTRWAVLELRTTGAGILGKQIFDPGTHIAEGDPLAVIYADGEALPYSRPAVTVQVIAVRQEKPRRGTARNERDAAI